MAPTATHTKHCPHRAPSLGIGALPTPRTACGTGGTFSTLEADGYLHKRRFERGDAIIFLSHKFHCVAPVTSGRRNVLVCELWEGVARPCPRRCSDPFGPCYCKYAPAQTSVYLGGAQTPIAPEWVRVRKPGTADSPHFVRNAPEDAQGGGSS